MQPMLYGLALAHSCEMINRLTVSFCNLQFLVAWILKVQRYMSRQRAWWTIEHERTSFMSRISKPFIRERMSKTYHRGTRKARFDTKMTHPWLKSKGQEKLQNLHAAKAFSYWVESSMIPEFQNASGIPELSPEWFRNPEPFWNSPKYVLFTYFT